MNYILVGFPISCLSVLTFTVYDKVWLSLACCLSVIWNKNEGCSVQSMNLITYLKVTRNFLRLQLLWTVIFTFMLLSLTKYTFDSPSVFYGTVLLKTRYTHSLLVWYRIFECEMYVNFFVISLSNCSKFVIVSLSITFLCI